MATWHQQKAGLAGLYTPHPTEFKVIVDKPHELAFGMGFSDAAAAQTYADRTGGRVILPGYHVTGPGDYMTRDGRRVTIHEVSTGPATFPVKGSIWKMFRGRERPRGYQIWTRMGRRDVLKASPGDIVGPWPESRV